MRSFVAVVVRVGWPEGATPRATQPWEAWEQE
jgi:hypothetical protein